MNKVFLIFALLFLIGCSENTSTDLKEGEDPNLGTEVYSAHCKSFDNKYAASFLSEKIVVALINGESSFTINDIIWERSLEKLDDEELGYGEHKAYTLVDLNFFRNTYNLFTLYRAAKTQYLFFYDEKGKVLNQPNKTPITNIKTNCPWDKDCMILGIDQTEEDTYYVYDYKGTEKEILKYKGKYNILGMSWESIEDNRYFSCSNNAICFISFQDKEIKIDSEINLPDYIKNLYPNEENTPKINEVVDYEVNKERCKVELEVILFNSQKEIVTVILNSNTGEIITPNQITQ